MIYMPSGELPEHRQSLDEVGPLDRRVRQHPVVRAQLLEDFRGRAVEVLLLEGRALGHGGHGLPGRVGRLGVGHRHGRQGPDQVLLLHEAGREHPALRAQRPQRPGFHGLELHHRERGGLLGLLGRCAWTSLGLRLALLVLALAPAPLVLLVLLRLAAGGVPPPPPPSASVVGAAGPLPFSLSSTALSSASAVSASVAAPAWAWAQIPITCGPPVEALGEARRPLNQRAPHLCPKGLICPHQRLHVACSKLLCLREERVYGFPQQGLAPQDLLLRGPRQHGDLHRGGRGELTQGLGGELQGAEYHLQDEEAAVVRGLLLRNARQQRAGLHSSGELRRLHAVRLPRAFPLLREVASQEGGHLRLEVGGLLPHPQLERRLVIVTGLSEVQDVLPASLGSPPPVQPEAQCTVQAPGNAVRPPVAVAHIQLGVRELPAAGAQPRPSRLCDGTRAAVPLRTDEHFHVETDAREAVDLHRVGLVSAAFLHRLHRRHVARLRADKRVEAEQRHVLLLLGPKRGSASSLRVQDQGEPPVLLLVVHPGRPAVVAAVDEHLVYGHGEGADATRVEAVLAQAALRPVRNVLVALAPVLRTSFSEDVVEVGAEVGHGRRDWFAALASGRKQGLPKLDKEVEQRIVQVLAVLKALGIMHGMNRSPLKNELQHHQRRTIKKRVRCSTLSEPLGSPKHDA
mmetsp:Transcript_88829/g.251319  ORF Transcript_88829/g.251319 Transcript_88829/m.251319 type:complete len:685 (-) Transcript_88829:3-2057(-)